MSPGIGTYIAAAAAEAGAGDLAGTSVAVAADSGQRAGVDLQEAPRANVRPQDAAVRCA